MCVARISSEGAGQVKGIWEDAKRLRLIPLGLASGLAVALLGARIVRAEQGTYALLLWNLALAWIPWVASVLCVRARGAWLATTLVGWLLFFPNASYIVTDFVHLRLRPPIPLWYDVGMLAAFAWSGLLLAVTSLSAVHRRVEHALGIAAGWCFVLVASALSGLGIYLGRFWRLNSWDVVFAPSEIARGLFALAAHPLGHPRAWGVAVMFGALTFVVYSAFRSGSQAAEAS